MAIEEVSETSVETSAASEKEAPPVPPANVGAAQEVPAVGTPGPASESTGTPGRPLARKAIAASASKKEDAKKKDIRRDSKGFQKFEDYFR